MTEHSGNRGSAGSSKTYIAGQFGKPAHPNLRVARFLPSFLPSVRDCYNSQVLRSLGLSRRLGGADTSVTIAETLRRE
jgi:hypothetical protein